MLAKRRAPVAAVLGGMVLACGDSTGPVEPNRYRSARFVVIDSARVAETTVDSFIARLESDFDLVAAFLPTFEPPDSIVAYIRPGRGLPYMRREAWELAQYAEQLAFDYNVHLLVHIFTGYVKSQFLEEGIAVYGTEVLVPESRTVEPYRGQVPHAWVSLFAEHGTLIPLEIVWPAENVRFQPGGSSADASAWQFFIEAGSFTRWVFDEYGAATWRSLYDGVSPGTVLGFDLPTLETQWVAAAGALYPDPLSCAEALGEVGERESYWCARAEGG